MDNFQDFYIAVCVDGDLSPPFPKYEDAEAWLDQNQADMMHWWEIHPLPRYYVGIDENGNYVRRSQLKDK